MPISGSADRDKSLEREEALLSQIHELKQHVLQLQQENEAQANELAEFMVSVGIRLLLSSYYVLIEQ